MIVDGLVDALMEVLRERKGEKSDSAYLVGLNQELGCEVVTDAKHARQSAGRGVARHTMEP